MKLGLTSTVVALSSASIVSGLSYEGKRSLLSKARRLDDSDNDVLNYLMNYSVKLMQCNQDESLSSYENDGNGVDGSGVVSFRMCPSDSCSDESGCSSGYADFAISLGDYVDAFLDDQKDNMNWDDNFDLENFSQCAEYEVENGNNNNQAYYVGPACTDSGKDIRLSLFQDAYCSTVDSETSFETISNGWQLPFSEGGLVSENCVSCIDNNNNGALRDMCATLYETSPHKCESWAIQHYYWDSITEVNRFGLDQTGCLQIRRIDMSKAPFSEWGGLFFVFFLVLVTVVGGAWYVIWWKDSKFNGPKPNGLQLSFVTSYPLITIILQQRKRHWKRSTMTKKKMMTTMKIWTISNTMVKLPQKELTKDRLGRLCSGFTR